MNHTISLRYAKALFVLDKKSGNLESRLKDFKMLLDVFDANSKLFRYLKAPYVHVKEKNNMIRDILKDEYDSVIMNFLLYLVKKGRINNFELIAKHYRHMVNEELGIWEADIITAVPLDEENETNLKKSLSEKFRKKIVLSNKVDPKIIGGVILVVGNEMLDFSVTGRLKKIKENLNDI